MSAFTEIMQLPFVSQLTKYTQYNPFFTSAKISLTQTPTKMSCTYTPPADQDITVYMKRLNDIIAQLNNNKDIAIATERLELLKGDIRTVITSTTTSTRDLSGSE
jgi:hypothetical protein